MDITQEITTLIKKNAILCHALNQQIHITFPNRHKNTQAHEAWLSACENFHQQYNRLAFPGGVKNLYERLAIGDFYTMEAAICFLEVRPYFFRSGYMYQKLMRKLKSTPLTEGQRKRFDSIHKQYQLWKAIH